MDPAGAAVLRDVPLRFQQGDGLFEGFLLTLGKWGKIELKISILESTSMKIGYFLLKKIWPSKTGLYISYSTFWSCWHYGLPEQHYKKNIKEKLGICCLKPFFKLWQHHWLDPVVFLSNFVKANGALHCMLENTAAIAGEMLIHVAGHLKQQSKLTAELVLEKMFLMFTFMLTVHQLRSPLTIISTCALKLLYFRRTCFSMT